MHHAGRAENGIRQRALLSQPRRTLHHLLHGGQRPGRPERVEQPAAAEGIGRIAEHPFQWQPLACHSLHQISGEALLLQQAHLALTQKLRQFDRQCGGIEGALRQDPAPVLAGAAEQSRKIKAPAPPAQDQQQPVAGTPQRVGIRGAAGPLATGEDAQEQLQPLGQRHHRTGIGVRQFVAGRAGLVVLQNRKGHRARLSLSQQVFATHHPLQLRKLPHHLADQIVLAEVGGTAGVGRHRVGQRQAPQQHIGAPFQPFHPVAQAAQTFGEGDPPELVATVDAGHGAVGMQEEFRIGQAGPQHSLVATTDRGRGFGAAIGNAEKPRQQRSMGLEGEGIRRGIETQQRHIALVGPHHRSQHLRRQRQKALLDLPLQQAGRFHQIHQLLEQGFWEIRSRLGLGGGGFDRGTDGGGARIALHLHIGRRQAGGVDVGARERQRTRPQAMATADAITHNGGIAVGQGDRHDLAAEKRHEPAQRAAEAAIRRAPAHEPAPLQHGDPGGHQLAEHLQRGPSSLLDGGEHERSPVGVAHREAGGVDPAAAGEPLRGGGGTAIAKGLLSRWPLAVFAAIRLTRRQIEKAQGQPPRGAVHTDGAGLQAGFRQVVFRAQAQLLQGLRCEIGRQLLGADLEQECGHGVDLCSAVPGRTVLKQWPPQRHRGRGAPLAGGVR